MNIPSVGGRLLKIQEIDGSPSGFPHTLKVSNGTLADNGDGTFTLTIGAGGSSEWTDTGTLLHPADLSGAEDVAIGRTTALESARLTVSKDGLPAYIKCNTDDFSNQAIVVDGNSNTSASQGDQAYFSLYLADDGTTPTEFARLIWEATDVSSGSHSGKFVFSLADSGSMNDVVQITTTAVSPFSNNGSALGTTSLQWADLFLASGGVINWSNGNAALTHSTGQLAVTAGNLRVSNGDLLFTERADHAFTPAAGTGQLWVKNTSPCTIIFTDDAGTDTTLGGGLSADGVEAQHLADSALSSGARMNYSLSASVAASALTITLNAADGSAPASDDPVLLAFRNSTLATGTEIVRSVTASTTQVISSGSTLGTSNGTGFRLWIVAFDDGGTIRIGVVNANFAYGLYEGMFHSGTSEGGAGGADSEGVIYTGATVTSKPIKVLGYMDWNSGLTTAGTWDATPDRIQLYHAGIPLPGAVIQTRYTETTTTVTTSTIMPHDNSIPQNTEGAECMTLAITPTSQLNRLDIRHGGFYASGGSSCQVAFFQDSTADALIAWQTYLGTAASGNMGYTWTHSMIAGTTSSTTLKVRMGPHQAVNAHFLKKHDGNDIFSTRSIGHMLIQEIQA